MKFLILSKPPDLALYNLLFSLSLRHILNLMFFCFLKVSTTLQTFFVCFFFKAIKTKNNLFVAMENSDIKTLEWILWAIQNEIKD